MSKSNAVGPRLPGKIERWPVGKLIPYERNAMTHSPEQIAQIAASIQEYGFTAPIAVDEMGVILYGHGRLAASLMLGLAEVPVLILDHLSEAQKRAYRIMDNRSAELACWDEELLAAELAQLEGEGFDLELTGFGDAELEDLLHGETEIQEHFYNGP